MKDGRSAKVAIRRINECVQSKRPFFLGIGFSRPHDPFFAPKRFFDLYPLEKLRLPKAPEGAFEAPMEAYNANFKKAFDSMDERDGLEFMRAYYAGISYMDEQLGRVLDHAEGLGLLKNTVIVFLGDHGYQVGEKDYFNKTLLFERSCRAPLILAAPNLQAGGSIDRVVQFIDIFPTVTELCHLPTPSNVDGKSLLPLVRSKTTNWEDAAYSYVNQDRSVRTDQFRYIRWRGKLEALYDHHKDPGEHFNLVDDPEYKKVLERLRHKVDVMPEFRKPSKRK
ncbi:MAG: sulfatase-like hydrolase/transferase [Planctomycetes bacterium]|nr:sulfatase-like hydrolase/transferase [Planctomycetota bacterium]